jgi:hypothetical protein
VRKDIIRMSKEEIDRLAVVQEVLGKRRKQREAAHRLSLSTRQVRRIIRKVQIHGEIGIVHGNRGRVSPRKYPEAWKEKVMAVVREKYYDFGPSLAAEKLAGTERLAVNRETLRQWMITQQLWTPRNLREKGQMHRWRKRKDCFGEMVQTDGSIHDWLEGRGPEMVLMAYIDDATSTVLGRFYPQETSHAALDSFRKYIERYGLPQSLYFDRHSIYKTTRQANLDEQLAGQSPKTQFELVLDILNVQPIYAYTPQAKGRVERLFGTFQDRLIKEMRLAGIENIEQANRFLEEFLPRYNAVFAVPPANPKNLHKPLPVDVELNWVFAFREKRVVAGDYTIAWNNRSFLLTQPSSALIKQSVTVLENLSGQIRIWGNNRFLEFREITGDTLRHIRRRSSSRRISTARSRHQPWKPPRNHPWRIQNRALFAELCAECEK